MTSDTDLVRRAMAAWFRSGRTAQPSNGSGVFEVGGRRYVELLNVNGVFAIYRVENSGRLKRLRRWPLGVGARIAAAAHEAALKRLSEAEGIGATPEPAPSVL